MDPKEVIVGWAKQRAFASRAHQFFRYKQTSVGTLAIRGGGRYSFDRLIGTEL
jgi:hypothetical protein